MSPLWYCDKMLKPMVLLKEAGPRHVNLTGKSHPWTNTNVGGTLEEALIHTNFPRQRDGPMIGPYEVPPKLVWTNYAQRSLKVSVLTGIEYRVLFSVKGLLISRKRTMQTRKGIFFCRGRGRGVGRGGMHLRTKHTPEPDTM